MGSAWVKGQEREACTGGRGLTDVGHHLAVDGCAAPWLVLADDGVVEARREDKVLHKLLEEVVNQGHREGEGHLL